MSEFRNEFSDEVQIITSNIIGIISSLIFIYTSYKAAYYTNIYIQGNNNIFTFISNVGIIKVFIILITILFSTFLSLYSMYINSEKVIKSNSIFNKICGGIGAIVTILGAGLGLYNSKNIFKLFIIIILASILIFSIIGMLSNSDD